MLTSLSTVESPFLVNAGMVNAATRCEFQCNRVESHSSVPIGLRKGVVSNVIALTVAVFP